MSHASLKLSEIFGSSIYFFTSTSQKKGFQFRAIQTILSRGYFFGVNVGVDVEGKVSYLMDVEGTGIGKQAMDPGKIQYTLKFQYFNVPSV